MDELSRIVESALADFSRSADAVALENAKAKYLGKAGALTGQLKMLGKLAPSERAATTTWAPAFASPSATARPMPRDAPVTSAMRPLNGPSVIRYT